VRSDGLTIIERAKGRRFEEPLDAAAHPSAMASRASDGSAIAPEVSNRLRLASETFARAASPAWVRFCSSRRAFARAPVSRASYSGILRSIGR